MQVTAHDWTPYFQYVIHNLEGNPDPAAPSKREEELREKHRQVVFCDIKAESDVFEPAIPQNSFDIISTNYCLDVIATSVEEYERMVRRVSQYVKPGGFMISLVLTEASWYSIGGEKYHNLYITSEEIHTAFTKAGLSIRDSTHYSLPLTAQGILNDCKGLHFIVTQKDK